MKTLSLVLPLIAISIGIAQEPTPMPKEYHNQLIRYVGVWETEVAVDGTTLKGTFSGKMAPGGECLVYHSTSPGVITKDKIIQGTGIIGWDPVKKQLMEVYFNSLGETNTTMWTFKNGRLTGTRNGVILGQQSESKVENVWVRDAQEWQHKVTQWILAGEKRDDVVRTFRRK